MTDFCPVVLVASLPDRSCSAAHTLVVVDDVS